MKIVIVDDERFSVKWMEKLVAQMQGPYEVVAAFQNGQAALDYCLSHPVDVLLTDIRMPVMDGIELIRRLRAAGKTIYPIIVSAYDEFIYAREAMKLEVIDYVVKAEMTGPLLRECFDRAQSYLAQHLDTGRSRADWTDWVLSVLTGSASAQDEQAMANQLSGAQEKPCAYIIGRCQDADMMDRAESIVPAWFESCQICTLVFQKVSRHRFLMIIQDNGHLKEAAAQWDNLSDFFHGKIGAAVCTGSASEPASCIRKAFDISIIQVFYSDYRWLMREDLIDSQAWGRLDVCDGTEIGSLKEIRERLSALFDSARQRMPESADLYQSVHRLVACVIPLIRSVAPEAEEAVWQALRPAKQFEAYRESVERLFAGLEERTRPCEQEKSCPLPVRKAIAYIEEHYREHISLQDIADAVYLNRTYLSTMFKRETGVGISDYLQQIRLEKAAAMLREGNESISAVVEAVGISDAAYFSKLFRSRYGMTPSEYRKT